MRATLIRLTRAPRLDPGATNAILNAAGFDPVPPGTLAMMEAVRTPLSRMQQEIAQYRWPSLIINERHEILGWNDAANRVAELDFARDLPLPYQRNLLRIGAMPHFRSRILNWESVVAVPVGMSKQDEMDPEAPEEHSRYFVSLVDGIHSAYPDGMRDLVALWRATAPRRKGGRVTFPLVWRTTQGTVLRFNCVNVSWSSLDALTANDWNPADAATWTWLDGHVEPGGATEPLSDDADVEPVTNHNSGEVPSEVPRIEALRWARIGTGMTQEELAGASGISRHSIASYESGRRIPSREVALQLTRAMQLDGATANLILTSLGWEPEPSEWSLFICGLPRRTQTKRYRAPVDARRTREEIQQAIAAHPWPCLIINDRCEISCWNTAAARVTGLDFDNLPQSHLGNVAGFALSRYVRDCAVNWEDLVAAFLSGGLWPHLRSGKSAPIASRLQLALDAIEREDPGILGYVTDLWIVSPCCRERLAG